jgi:hypothetical protein
MPIHRPAWRCSDPVRRLGHAEHAGPTLEISNTAFQAIANPYDPTVSFTPLHRALGLSPGPLTSEMLDAAVAARITETDDLDWKSQLPPVKGLSQTDFPKDVAAMANSGGGIIVFGVRESQKAATERVDTGELDEVHERALRSVAITAISPPVFGLGIHRLGTDNNRAVVVEVPASVDGPHLIYKNEYFGAPVRNDADTVWMKERQIEAMYRARFDERRHATDALDGLYREASAGRDTSARAWLIAVAHPRIPRSLERLSQADVRSVLEQTDQLALEYAPRGLRGVHPIENVDRLNPRPGLRRWVAVNAATSELSSWREAWASIHHDGSVTLAAAIGGHRVQEGHAGGWQVDSASVECAVADLMALARATAAASGTTDYDIRVGIDWTSEHPLVIEAVDELGYPFSGTSIPMAAYTPVETTVAAAAAEEDYLRQVHDLAQDCVNQGGVSNLRLIKQPDDVDT